MPQHSIRLKSRFGAGMRCSAVTPPTHKPTHPTPQIVQAAALCRGIVDFIESRLGAGAAARVPVLIGGDFNSLPAKWASDAFDRVGAL